jgi:hypothetical protein
LLSAVTGDTELVPEMQLRKWMQVLINRSIVLGTWERPQLHDITRDYAIALHSPKELQELQRKVVDAFAAQRPASAQVHGMRMWIGQDECTRYVRQQIEHHIRSSLDLTADGIDSCVEAWLSHYPVQAVMASQIWHQDELGFALARVVGIGRIQAIVHNAAERGDHWLVFCADQVHFMSLLANDGIGAVFNPNDKARQVFEVSGKTTIHMLDHRPAQMSVVQYEFWELSQWSGNRVIRGALGLDAFEMLPWLKVGRTFAQQTERFIHLLENTEVGRTFVAMGGGSTVAEVASADETWRLEDAGDFAPAHTKAAIRFKDSRNSSARRSSRLRLLA